jgi:hypothetical protein
MLSVYYMYLKMQYQICTSNSSDFEDQGSDGSGFRNDGNIVKSDGFYYDMKYTVQPDFSTIYGN